MGSIRRRETGLGRANLIMEWKSTHQAASYVERSLQNPSRPDFSIHPNPSEESKTTKNHARYAKIITFITKKNTHFLSLKNHQKNGHPSFTRKFIPRGRRPTVVLPPRPWHRRNVCSMALLVQLRLQD